MSLAVTSPEAPPEAVGASYASDPRGFALRPSEAGCPVIARCRGC